MKFKSFFVYIRSAVHGVHSKIKNKEMGGHVARMWERKLHREVWRGDLTADHMEDLRVDRRMILYWIWRKSIGRA